MPDGATPVYYDNHMHTPLCKHALGEPEEYAAVGSLRALKGIVFTCHSPMPDGFWPRVRMAPDQLGEYVGIVRRATEMCAGTIDVRLGMESDFFPGMESWVEDLHASAPFHHCLGSVHYFGPEYQERFWNNSLDKFQRLYFDHLAESAETGLFDTLAHPDLIKNLSPDDYHFERLQDSIEGCLDRIAATGVAMELNTSGRHKRFPEMNPGPQMLQLMQQRGIPAVIGSDSHRPQRVGDGFREALGALKDAGYSKVSYFLERKRHDVAIDSVAASLEPTVTY